MRSGSGSGIKIKKSTVNKLFQRQLMTIVGNLNVY